MTQNKDSESKSSWRTQLIYVLWIYIGLTFIDTKVKRIGFIHRINTEIKKVINKDNQEVIPNNQYTKETIIPSDTQINVNLDEPIKIEENHQTKPIQDKVSYQTESNDNSSEIQINESDSRTCKFCNGDGIIVGCKNKIWPPGTCKNGKKYCDYCRGRQYDNDGRICINCNGQGLVFCENCKGYPNNARYYCFWCDVGKNKRNTEENPE
jgi:hypothetical protein